MNVGGGKLKEAVKLNIEVSKRCNPEYGLFVTKK